jgi:NADH dehydrogenase [ubiquinone] 1 alpha subcomplex assembly factor 7
MTRGTLEQRLIRRILAEGPITVADYMAQVLTDPEAGYYTTRDPLGAEGDFVTAPEVSQMFGELIGLWGAEAWQRQGRPGRMLWAELGPGRGSLSADALRAARMVPGFAEALELHLVEVSPTLREAQARTLAGQNPAWHAELAGLPEAPALIVANEFFDALPVRQMEKTPTGWCERLVGYDPEADRLIWALTRPSARAAGYVPAALRDAPPGAVFEVSPAGLTLAAELGRRVAAQGGAALILDYGRAESACAATLQAVRRHARAEVLQEPGTADLTAHVDFQLLAQAAREAGAEAHGPVGQGSFLRALGLDQRTAILQRQAGPEKSEAIERARARLVDADQMGELFKALAIVPPGYGVPAGFPETGG